MRTGGVLIEIPRRQFNREYTNLNCICRWGITTPFTMPS